MIPHDSKNHSGSLTEVYRDAFMTVVAEKNGSLIRLNRSALPHATPAELTHAFTQVAAAIDNIGRKNRVMLIDMREAKGRNEPEFEAALRKIRPLVERGMQRIVVLLRSTVGVLHMKRVNEEDGIERYLAMDENDALEYLRTGIVPGEPVSMHMPSVSSRRR